MEDYSINLRGLNEVVFCPKLYHLMYVQGIFNNNEDTLSGSLNHKIREKSSRNDKLDGANIFSSVLYAMDGCLSAKLDGVLVENGEYIPIEDKNSKAPAEPIKATLWNINVCTDIWLNDFLVCFIIRSIV